MAKKKTKAEIDRLRREKAEARQQQEETVGQKRKIHERLGELSVLATQHQNILNQVTAEATKLMQTIQKLG